MRIEEALHTGRFQGELHKAHLNLLHTAAWLRAAIGRCLRPFGISHEQYNVLRILAGAGEERLCIRDIAGRMVEQHSSVSRLVDKLESKQLITRNISEQDRREWQILITPAGLALLEEVRRDGSLELLHRTGPDELEARLLNVLLDRLRAGLAAPPAQDA